MIQTVKSMDETHFAECVTIQIGLYFTWHCFVIHNKVVLSF